MNEGAVAFEVKKFVELIRFAYKLEDSELSNKMIEMAFDLLKKGKNKGQLFDSNSRSDLNPFYAIAFELYQLQQQKEELESKLKQINQEILNFECFKQKVLENSESQNCKFFTEADRFFRWQA